MFKVYNKFGSMANGLNYFFKIKKVILNSYLMFKGSFNISYFKQYCQLERQNML